jgi:hypothetical protein
MQVLTSDDSVRNNGSLGKRTDTSLLLSIQGRNRFYQCYCYNFAAEPEVAAAVVAVAVVAACLDDCCEGGFDYSHLCRGDYPNLKKKINIKDQGRAISMKSK